MQQQIVKYTFLCTRSVHNNSHCEERCRSELRGTTATLPRMQGALCSFSPCNSLNKDTFGVESLV